MSRGVFAHDHTRQNASESMPLDSSSLGRTVWIYSNISTSQSHMCIRQTLVFVPMVTATFLRNSLHGWAEWEELRLGKQDSPQTPSSVIDFGFGHVDTPLCPFISETPRIQLPWRAIVGVRDNVYSSWHTRTKIMNVMTVEATNGWDDWTLVNSASSAVSCVTAQDLLTCASQ